MDRAEERRQGMSRLIGLHQDDGSFDREFWRGLTGERRLEIVWDMALDSLAWRGGDGGEPRLQRSVCALNAASARYLLVGGYAVAFHAEPRFTKDLDVWVEPTTENSGRVHAALAQFGAPLGELTPADLAVPGLVFQMGLPPNRIDILTAVDGVDFPACWDARIATRYGGQDLHVIGIDDLIRNKRTTGRPQDLLDVQLLLRPR
jgi:hypothetical protein